MTAGRCPSARWAPIPVNYTPGGCTPRLWILHIMAGTMAGTDAWFRDPASQVSAHFGIPKNGQARQWVNTHDTAWHAASANPYATGIECEGQSGDSLTASQIREIAAILAWSAAEHGIPLQITNNTGGRGLAYHALGGAAWGGHPACPGAPVIAARPAIIESAQGGPTPSAEDDDMQGFLKTGPKALTVISIKGGSAKEIQFIADYTLQGTEAPTLRIAAHSAAAGWGEVTHLTLPADAKARHHFTHGDVNGISIRRGGQGDDAEVGWNLV